MGKGRRYELDMVRAINEYVDSDYVFASTLDYSGVADDSDADLLVQWPHGREDFRVNLVELKKRSCEKGKRVVAMAGNDSQSGHTELTRLVDAGPNYAESWLTVKFPHSEAITVPAGWVYEQVTQRPRDLPADWREQRVDRTSLSEAAQSYAQRIITPYWWDASSSNAKALSPRLTDAENISLVRPSDLPSARSGSDVAAMLSTMGLPEQNRS